MSGQAGDLTKLATLENVVELNEGYPVELWLTEAGRVVIRAWNECQNNYTDVDLFQFLAALDGSGDALSGATPFPSVRASESN